MLIKQLMIYKNILVKIMQTTMYRTYKMDSSITYNNFRQNIDYDTE